MAKLLQIFLLCCIAINRLTAPLDISCGEEASSLFIEGQYNPTCYCSGIQDDMTRLDWTFVHETGRLENLATCYGQGNCTTFANFGLQASMSTGSYSIGFNNLTSGLTGTLMCSETTRTSHGSAIFQMKVTRVSIGSKVNYLLEGSSSDEIFCQHSEYTPNTVTWTIITHGGQPLQLGSCSSSDNYNCTSLVSPTITLGGTSTSSYLQFNNGSIHRNMSAVVCTVTFADSVDADNSTLDVYSQAIVENCSIEVHQQNWSFILSCDISNAFTSQGQYNFKVDVEFYLLLRDQLREVMNTNYNDYRSYQQFLTSYINSTNNQMYYRGRLEYSWPVSPYPGTYRSLEVETTHFATAQLIFKDGLNVSYPVSPTHNCSDVLTPCSCSTETLGSPAGRLLWIIGNTTVAVGDYGVNQLPLPLDNLPGGQDVTVAKCQLDWIQIVAAEEPAILRRERKDTGEDTGEDNFKILTIAGWSLLIVVLVLNVIVVVILMHQGHLFERPCTNSAEGEEADEVVSQNYVRLQTSRVVRGGTKGEKKK